MQDLASRLNTECNHQPFETCFYFQSLTDSCVVARNAEKVIPSGSTRKIVIMMRIFVAVCNKELNLTDTVTLEPSMQYHQRASGGGIIHLFNPGIPLTVWDLLMCMITLSDTAAAGILGNLIGGIDELNRYTRKIGMTRTWHQYLKPPPCASGYPRTVTCARDMAHILHLILLGSQQDDAARVLQVNSRSCQMALFILSNQKLNTRLPVFLPPGYIVCHKGGTTCEILPYGSYSLKLSTFGDVGIVLDEKRRPLFILAVFTHHVPPVIGRISGQSVANLHMAKLCFIGANI